MSIYFIHRVVQLELITLSEKEIFLNIDHIGYRAMAICISHIQ